MKSRITDDFWECYKRLPESIKMQAREAFRLFINEPFHPGLHFKRIHANRPIFSIIITKDYRAVGIQQGDDIIWFWIGSHSGYEELLKRYGR